MSGLNEEMELAAKSSVSPEEIRMLLEGCRRSVQRLENIVWSEAERVARLQFRSER